MSQFPDDFFDAMVPFLRGETDSNQLGQILGPSSSGAGRVEFYRTLMTRNVRQILAALFPAVHKLAERHQAGLFLELVQQFDDAHFATHREPNLFGRHFPAFLASVAEQRGLAGYFEEVADYEWSRYAAGVVKTFAEPFGDPDLAPSAPGEVRFIVRAYDYDVVELVRLARSAATSLQIALCPTTVLTYQDVETGNARSFRPDAAQLLVLAQASGLTSSHLLAQVTRAQAQAARRDLVTRGILPRASADNT